MHKKNLRAYKHARTLVWALEWRRAIKAALPIPCGGWWRIKKVWGQVTGWDQCFEFPSVFFWHCRLDHTKNIRLVKTCATCLQRKPRGNWPTHIHPANRQVHMHKQPFVAIFHVQLGQPVINKKQKKWWRNIQSKFSSGLLVFCDKLAADTDLYFSTKQQPFDIMVIKLHF